MKTVSQDKFVSINYRHTDNTRHTVQIEQFYIDALQAIGITDVPTWVSSHIQNHTDKVTKCVKQEIVNELARQAKPLRYGLVELPTKEPLSELELLRIENAKLQAKLEIVDKKARPFYSDCNLVQIAFFSSTYGELKRQYVTLDGFYVNALMIAAGIDKKGVSKWIQKAVDDWKEFDDKLPITKQVKFLIIRELVRKK